LLTDLFNNLVKYLSGLQQLFNKDICPSLKDFEFSGDSNIDFVYTSPDAGGEDYPDFFDIDNNNDVLGDNLDISDDVSGVFEDDINPHARFTEKDYVMAMVSNENELFSYFDSAFLRNWAGPEHWKLKRTNKSI
jgi:condensin complex subunit 2